MNRKNFQNLILCLTLLFSSNVANTYQKHYDVRNKSTVQIEHLDKKFKGKLKGTGKHFIKAQEKYGVNAVFLSAIAIHESGNGMSLSARTRNNLFGLVGKSGKYMRFNSVKDCIFYAAENISKDNGYYFGRGRYTIHRIAKRYAADKNWCKKVYLTMKSIYIEEG